MTIESILFTLTDSLNRIIPFLFLVATVAFLWGIVRYITAGGNEDQTTEARKLIMYAIIAFAVMIAVWGFVNILITFIFDSPNPNPQIPGEDIVPTI